MLIGSLECRTAPTSRAARQEAATRRSCDGDDRGGTERACSVCQLVQQQAAFSKSQWEGASHKRRCLACTREQWERRYPSAHARELGAARAAALLATRKPPQPEYLLTPAAAGAGGHEYTRDPSLGDVQREAANAGPAPNPGRRCSTPGCDQPRLRPNRQGSVCFACMHARLEGSIWHPGTPSPHAAPTPSPHAAPPPSAFLPAPTLPSHAAEPSPEEPATFPAAPVGTASLFVLLGACRAAARQAAPHVLR